MIEFEELYKMYFDDVFKFLRGMTANEHWACVIYHRAKVKIQERMEEYYEN